MAKEQIENELDACEDENQYLKSQNGRLRKRVSELEKDCTEDTNHLIIAFITIITFVVTIWIVVDIIIKLNGGS